MPWSYTLHLGTQVHPRNIYVKVTGKLQGNVTLKFFLYAMIMEIH